MLINWYPCLLKTIQLCTNIEMTDTMTTHCTIDTRRSNPSKRNRKYKILTEWFGICHRLAPILHEVDNCRSIIQRERKQRYGNVNERQTFNPRILISTWTTWLCWWLLKSVRNTLPFEWHNKLKMRGHVTWDSKQHLTNQSAQESQINWSHFQIDGTRNKNWLPPKHWV